MGLGSLCLARILCLREAPRPLQRKEASPTSPAMAQAGDTESPPRATHLVPAHQGGARLSGTESAVVCLRAGPAPPPHACAGPHHNAADSHFCSNCIPSINL